MKSLRFSVALVLLSLSLQGQDYFTFPTDSAIWVDEYTLADFGTVYEEGVNIYVLLGDTVIDGLSYSILWLSDCADYDIGCRDIYGFLREENKRIYYMGEPFSLDEEQILYDFNYYEDNGTILYDGPDSLNN